ncbi:MAG TPA: dienelactone hydrolase family protein [Acidimicrobiales bacterium]|jgi:dienelactone hydrolase
MTDILLFPSVLGVRAGVTDTADRLRAAGHRVEVVDVLDGQTFDSYEPALAHADATDGNAREALALERSKVVNGPFHAVGFSSGAALAMYVATQRPQDVRGVVVVGGAMPVKYLGDGTAPWPSGVPVQEHMGDHDDFDDGPEVRAEFVADVEQAGATPELFRYPDSGHLFNEPGLPAEHNPAAAEELYARLLAFVAG